MFSEVPETREQMIERCRRSDPGGKNRAVQRHIKQLEAMSEYDYELHRASMVERRKRFAPTAVRLSRELWQKTR